MAIAVTKDGATLSKLITGIRRRTASLQADMHVIAVSCVMHAVEFGNALPATQLVEAITGGSKSYAIRANALKKWFEEVGCFVWNNGETPGFKMNADRKAIIQAIGDDNAIIAEIGKVPFWEYAPEPEYKGFDLVKAIRALVSKANKNLQEHGNDANTKIDPAMLSALSRLTIVDTTDDDDDNGDEAAPMPYLEAPIIEGEVVSSTIN